MRLGIDRDNLVQISLTDISSKLVSSIFDGTLKSGIHEFEVITAQVVPGMYLLNVRTGNQVRMLKIAVTR